MMKAGGESKRRELISLFGDLSLTGTDKSKMSEEEAKRGVHGEDG